MGDEINKVGSKELIKFFSDLNTIVSGYQKVLRKMRDNFGTCHSPYINNNTHNIKISIRY